MKWPFVFLAILSTGCSHTMLRRSTVQTSDTLSGIYQQQVLNNLAMFAADPHSVPHFAVPNTGSSDVTDKASIAGTPFRKFDDVVGINGDRTLKVGWSLTPITDPDKLRRMRCAFQRAVGCIDTECSQCCDLRKTFVNKKDTTVALFNEKGEVARDPGTGQPYLGTVTLEERDVIDPKTLQPDGQRVWVYVPVVIEPEQLEWGFELKKRQAFSMEGIPLGQLVSIREERHGRTKEVRLPNYDCNAACEVHPCWFEVKKFSFLNRIGGPYVGTHRCTAVVVPPSGRDDLGRLTLEILEYALKDPSTTATRTKEVQLFFDEAGQAATKDTAFQVVKAVVPITSKNVAVAAGKIEIENVPESDSDLSDLSDTELEILRSDVLQANSQSMFNELIEEDSMKAAAKAEGILDADVRNSGFPKARNQLLELIDQAKRQRAKNSKQQSLDAEREAKRIQSVEIPTQPSEPPSFDFRSFEILNRINNGR